MTDKHQGPFLGVPSGGNWREEPDGNTAPGGTNSLRDSHSRPEIYNPDWPRRPTFPPPKGTT